jgi:hypothetical protein
MGLLLQRKTLEIPAIVPATTLLQPRGAFRRRHRYGTHGPYIPATLSMTIWYPEAIGLLFLCVGRGGAGGGESFSRI